MLRLVSWFLLASSVFLTSGCLDTILGVMLAPEAVVAGTAQQAAQAGAQTLADSGLNDLTSTAAAVQDVDRILHNTSDPTEQAKLQSLRDKLVDNEKQAEGTSPLSSYTHQDQQSQLRRPADAMTINPRAQRDSLTVVPPEPSDDRRPPPRPDVLPDNSSLQPDAPHGIAISLQPVRLNR